MFLRLKSVLGRLNTEVVDAAAHRAADFTAGAQSRCALRVMKTDSSACQSCGNASEATPMAIASQSAVVAAVAALAAVAAASAGAPMLASGTIGDKPVRGDDEREKGWSSRQTTSRWPAQSGRHQSDSGHQATPRCRGAPEGTIAGIRGREPSGPKLRPAGPPRRDDGVRVWRAGRRAPPDHRCGFCREPTSASGAGG